MMTTTIIDEFTDTKVIKIANVKAMDCQIIASGFLGRWGLRHDGQSVINVKKSGGVWSLVYLSAGLNLDDHWGFLWMD